ncbi:TPA: DNA cytosine methyltransferase [Stenotrophomonas maltophilia]|nr:DNA cytosine methyltransferase [Stenotrophomonas maltophilia]HEL3637598.1 DNA cytosine methyltransferase [Stenotrophomonas maltophilia]HEL3796147.1 DNA cytosine methyltransferase [Stenotrophomonas maltophilia]HEL3830021.1 DNA cytosine methyltransferase [Stenotrophomonas maltophilia]HEL4131554.1 DNA cytosine methyltransferase [Stenotrophomonas maltophilia]
MSLKSLDLFAGAGGLSEGLREAGFTPLYANEISPRYAQTYAINHPKTQVDSRDIRQVDARKIRNLLGLKRGELDLVAGGPPCQGFSINAPKRSTEDRRNHLFREYLRFVAEFQPRTVMIENVPGMVSYEGGATLDAILESLKQLGYDADVRILYAPHYGIPQTRWRTIILGARDGLNPAELFPEPLRSAPVRVNFTAQFAGRSLVALPRSLELPSHVTVRDAIGDLPILANGELGVAEKPYGSVASNPYQQLMRIGSTGVTCHEAPRLGKINMDRLAFIPPGGNWTDIPEALLPRGMRMARRSDHTKRYGRVDPDGLASTILTKCDPHWGAYFHYDQERAFTVREAARIQSFPDTYMFCGSRVEQYEQVGNAVPPLLGAAVGRAIAHALQSGRKSRRKVGAA